MPRRTQVMQKIPWQGGVNSSTDPGIIPDSDLTIADNVTFSTTGAKVKREGFTDWDVLSDIPTVLKRSSSGTTRTIQFAAAVSATLIDALVVGEGIIVTGASTGNEATYYALGSGVVASITTTTITNDSITYTAVGSLSEGLTSTSTLIVTRLYPIVRIQDYWRFTGSALAQLIIGVTSQPKIFKYDSAGRRKEVTKDASATARTGTATIVDSVVFQETLIVAQSRIGNLPIMYKPDAGGTIIGNPTGGDVDWLDLAGTPPDFSVMAVHLNRVFTNNKNNRDRVEYCATGNAAKWNGAEDSGAIDIRPGDGDPVGIIGFQVFKGRLFVKKKNKIYQIVGDTPENFQVVDVSQGIGSEAHLASAAVDQDDVLYLSAKGAHSLATTSSYGDFSSTYLSTKIQPTYNNFTLSRLPFAQAAYIAPINSVAFSISESNTNAADTIWLYNTQVKEWYRWPDVDCQSLGMVLLSSTPTLFYGTSEGKLVQTQNGTLTDFGTTGIRYHIKTGTIYPDGQPQTIKAFKRLTLFYRNTTAYTFTVKIKIDNASEQILLFAAESLGSDLLDTTFVLGSSLLGSSGQFAPNTLPFDGYGRGLSLEIEQSGSGEDIALYGYAIEYESADIAQETIANESGT